MSELERLIQQHCPNGIEYVPLGTVCQIGKGIQFNKSDMNDEGTYPVINGGINPSGYIEQWDYHPKGYKQFHPLTKFLLHLLHLPTNL